MTNEELDAWVDARLKKGHHFNMVFARDLRDAILAKVAAVQTRSVTEVKVNGRARYEATIEIFADLPSLQPTVEASGETLEEVIHSLVKDCIADAGFDDLAFVLLAGPTLTPHPDPRYWRS